MERVLTTVTRVLTNCLSSLPVVTFILLVCCNRLIHRCKTYVKRNLLTAVKSLRFSRAERSKLYGLMASLPVGFVVLQHV